MTRYFVDTEEYKRLIERLEFLEDRLVPNNLTNEEINDKLDYIEGELTALTAYVDGVVENLSSVGEV